MTTPQFKRKNPPKDITKPTIGRPSALDTLDLDKVKKLAKKGWTNDEMADFFKIPIDTWNTWILQYPFFSKFVRDWKLTYDCRVERALAERAMGYSHPEEKIFLRKVVDEFGERQEVIRVETIKHYPPDPTSMIFWLKSRLPRDWRDRKIVEHTGRDGKPIQIQPYPMKPAMVDLEDFSTAELELIASAGMKLNVKADDEDIVEGEIVRELPEPEKERVEK